MDQHGKLPAISVIVVTYNAAKTLQACLDSIFAQEYPAIRIVIMDGASTDGTLDVIRQNAHRLEYWKSEPDGGIYDAMNKALDHVTGEYVYFLGADDVLLPDFSRLAAGLRDPDGIYYGSVLTRGLKRWGAQTAYRQAKHGIFHQAIIYPAAVFATYRYDLRYPVFADAVLNMWCFRDKRFRFIFRDFVIANFNHTGTSGTDPDPRFTADKSRLIRENFGFATWLRYEFRQVKRRLTGKD